MDGPSAPLEDVTARYVLCAKVYILIEKVKLKLLKLKIIEMRSIILFLPFQTYVRKQSIY